MIFAVLTVDRSGRVGLEIANFPLSVSEGDEAHFKGRADGEFQTEQIGIKFSAH
jgi:hypothetical protein